MGLSISATTIKYFFQYRCERQVRYRMMSRDDLEAVPVVVAPDEQAPWAQAGDDYEEQVIEVLAGKQSVLRPPPGKKLSSVETLAFLRGQRPERFAHQLRLEFPPVDLLPPALRARWGLPDSVALAPGFPDLVEAVVENGVRVALRLIDIKATQHATLFHKAQVAYYALLLEAMLAAHGLDVPVHAEPQIWHAGPGSDPADPQRVPFRLDGYKAQVEDFLRRVAPKLATVPVEKGRDETEFYVYFKCEQCPYLPHCGRTVAGDVPPEALDLSAVPGLSRQTKQTLRSIGIRAVGDLATRLIEGDPGAAPENDLRRHPKANWSMRMNGDVLVQRARALVSGKVNRLPDRYTHQMPGKFEVGIYLAVDQDPVEGRLAALGCRCEWKGRQTAVAIEPVASHGPDAERVALRNVLKVVVETLSTADAHNAGNPPDPVRAHLFLFEPSEASDLAASLGRHLDDAGVRGGLLHMLRMFPPDSLPPEPQYKGVQHLPATALRGVVNALFALPARVSHDLRSVTEALAAADPPLAEPYQPGDYFRRPFSSRLNIEACRDLKAGKLDAAAARADVDARLRAMSSLAAWLVARNAEADGAFLRLDKQPFRWQATLDPLGAGDLDLLRAHELLQLRSAELQALVALAAPWQVRRDRLRCLARLRLQGVKRNPSRWVDLRLFFTVPPETRRAELEPGTFGLILTNDNPDLRLNPAAWRGVFAKLVDVRRKNGQVEAVVDVEEGGPLWDRLLRDTPADGWFLDQAHRDFNAATMDGFLHYLSGSTAVSDADGGGNA